MLYITFDSNGKIIGRGSCQEHLFSLVSNTRRPGTYVLRYGVSNYRTQKVIFDDFDDNGQPINPRVVDKTPEEIKTEEIAEEAERKRAEIPHEKQQAHITNEQYQSLLIRLSKLENISKENT